MGSFIQNQILGMQWLNTLIGKIISAAGLDIESRFGGSLHFFLYDVIKITILLFVLIFLISYIQSYFPPERSKKILSHCKGFSARIIAALLGTVTSFCSCSSIPLFMGFTTAGLPLGGTIIVFFTVKMRKGKSVRISIIAKQRQNSALFIFQNLFAFSICNLLLESSHWSEHIITSYFNILKTAVTSPLPKIFLSSVCVTPSTLPRRVKLQLFVS